MSFDINWDNLAADKEISENIRLFLHDQLNKLSLPSFIDNLAVTKFSLGHVPPQVTIRHIGDPFEEFYNDYREKQGDAGDDRQSPLSPEMSDEDSDSQSDSDSVSESGSNFGHDTTFPNDPAFMSPPSPAKKEHKQPEFLKNFHTYSMNNVGLGNHHITHVDSETPTNIFNNNNPSLRPSHPSTRENPPQKNVNDLQFIVDLDYKGDISIELTVNLLVNYPSTHFISLPIKLIVTDLVIHSLAAIAYLEDSVFVSFLCDLQDAQSDYFTSSNGSSSSANHTPNPMAPLGGNFTDYVASGNYERIEVIKNMRIESEIGELENNVLRNVGRVEKFLVDHLRSIIREEISWPSWVCLDLSPDEDDEDDEDDTESYEASTPDEENQLDKNN